MALRCNAGESISLVMIAMLTCTPARDAMEPGLFAPIPDERDLV
jgi:hypothetical protein